MNRTETVTKLINILLEEMPEYKSAAKDFGADYIFQRRLLRSLMNLRPPIAANAEFLRMQDELLTAEAEEKGIVDASKLPLSAKNEHIALWQGDITRLRADAVVNAANSKLLGCFHPCHGCIDNAIHSAAGVQLRLECADLMKKQGGGEPTGRAKLTKAYNLPSSYVIHTVGPIVAGGLSDVHRRQLADCYRSCLNAAADKGLKSIAFCCISTGEFRFPNRAAAEIAVRETEDFLKNDNRIKTVVFNVFKDEDYYIYSELLG